MDNPLYDKYATEYAQAVENNIFNAYYERPSLLSLFPEIKDKSVLDLGCGSGEYVNYFLNNGCSNLVAIDVSQAMVDIIKRKYGNGVECYRQDLNTGLPKEEDSTFDLVISALTIHYIENLSFLFKEIKRVLKKNSFFVFSTHHPFLDFKYSDSEDYFSHEQLTQTWNTIGKPIEVTFFRRPLSSTFDLLIAAGFNVVKISEGKPADELKLISNKHYNYLATKPQFIFFKCQKI